MLNRKIHKNNTSGITGIQVTDNGLYKVGIVRKFKDKEIAEAARNEVVAILNRYAIQDEL
jgi:hypothetical protein